MASKRVERGRIFLLFGFLAFGRARVAGVRGMHGDRENACNSVFINQKV